MAEITAEGDKGFDFEDIYTLKDDPKSFLGKKYAAIKKRVRITEIPDFPVSIGIEVTSGCNHECVFCGLPYIERPRSHIDPALFRSIVEQCFALGSREVSLVGGAEPLVNKRLEEYIAYCGALGFEYIYITTNGTLADAERWKRLIDAGLHSIKVSINGGDSETYRRVHCKDDFQKAVDSVIAIDEYRKTLDRPVFLGVACVETKTNQGAYAKLRDLLGDYADEIVSSKSIRPPGHPVREDVFLGDSMGEVVKAGEAKCYMPFSQANFSCEGYFRACCVEWDNDTALEDVKAMPVAKAWVSERFRSLRRRLIAEADGRGNLKGLLCEDCLYGGCAPFEPMNPELSRPDTMKSKDFTL